MKNKIILPIFSIVMFLLSSSSVFCQAKVKGQQQKTIQDTTKKNTAAKDSTIIAPKYKYKDFKKKVHASYYASKFNGKRTASGSRFDNNKYTAAHRKLPFGTLVRVTNEQIGKSVIVEITDRGPFSRGREIDLTKRAFMEIAVNKNSGSLNVTIEIIEK
jgi:rare lipoprotein A